MRERVQVQKNQGAQPLQSAARPGALTSGGARVEGSSSASLVRALSSVQPTLNNFLNQQQQEFEEQEAGRAYDTLQGMTFDEAKAMVESGNLRETENPWFEAAFQKQYGVAYAGKRKRDIMLAYETQFDKHNGDLEGFIAAQVKADAQRYGNNEFIRSGIRDGMGDFLGRLRDQHAEFKSSVVRSTNVDQFRAASATVIDEAVASGADPSASVRNLYEQHRKAFGLTYQQMDDNILSLAAEYAEAGDAATVRALLETEIIGSDGQKVGSFTSRARYADKAQTIINAAETTRGKLDRAHNTSEIVALRTAAGKGALTPEDESMLKGMARDGLISQEMQESLLVQNTNARQGALTASFAALQESSYKDHVQNRLLAGEAFGVTDFTYVDPATGKTKTIERDAVVDGVVTDVLTTMGQEGYSENEMAATLASWGVGSKYQVWENALSDGYLALSQTLSKAGEDGDVQLPPAALAGYGTWRNLAEHPNLRARHVTDSTALRLYRDAEALERGGMEPETALVTAGRIDRNANRNGISTQLDRNEFTQAVRKVTSGGWFGDDVANAGWVSSTVERSARILMDAGLPRDRAVEQAVKMFEDSHTNVNGVAVNTRNNLVPPNFSDMSEIILDEFAAQHGEDVDDLTIVPTLNGEQSWVVTRKDTMMPHEEWVNGGAYNISDLQERFEATRQQEREVARQQANDKIEGSIEFKAAKQAFEELDRRHRVNILNTPEDGPAWKRLQDKFGKEIYPDGGVPFYSQNRRGG